MRIWLIGADQKGTEALRQLKKNPNIEVIVSDATDQPKAVTERVIAKVDYVETLQATGFTIHNPNAVKTCGCGKSFETGEGGGCQS